MCVCVCVCVCVCPTCLSVFASAPACVYGQSSVCICMSVSVRKSTIHRENLRKSEFCSLNASFNSKERHFNSVSSPKDRKWRRHHPSTSIIGLLWAHVLKCAKVNATQWVMFKLALTYLCGRQFIFMSFRRPRHCGLGGTPKCSQATIINDVFLFLNAEEKIFVEPPAKRLFHWVQGKCGRYYH